MKKDSLRKLLAGFFLVMLLLSVLSRGAASVTVPRVKAQKVKEGSLTYRLEGTGVVEEEKTRSIPVISGLMVEEIFAGAGVQVKKGEKLFSYSMESIEEVLEKKKKELKQLLLSYEQEKAGAIGEDSQKEGADLSLEQAKKDLEDARLAIEEQKEEVREEAEKALDSVKEEYEALEKAWEEKLFAASQAVEDAKEAYEEQGKEKDKIESLLLAYQQAIGKGNEAEKMNCRQEIIKVYFGRDYQSYQNRKSQASKAVGNAKEDLADITAKWKELIDEWDKYSDDPEIKEKYRAQCRERDSEVKAAKRAIENAEAALKEETLEETRLTEAMERYEKGEAKGREELYELLAEKLKIEETVIEKEKKAWERAEEGLERLEFDAKEELARLEKKVLAAKQKLEAMEEGTYDYEKELKERKQGAQDAEYALRQAESTVKGTEDAAAQAAMGRGLRLESLAMDIEEKRQETEEFEELKRNGGCVASPADGTVSEQELKAGSIAGGQERVVLAADLYRFQAKVEASACEYFEPGDEIILNRERTSKSFFISSFSMEDEEGMKTLTVELPEEGYPLGSTWSFQAEKDSVSYEQKLPIQALRKDNGSYYVLVVMERPGILGTEEYLSRVGVEFLAKDDNFAAISGSLEREAKILVSGSRNVEDGDRVRLIED